MLGVFIKLGIDCDNFMICLLIMIITLHLNIGGWRGSKIFDLHIHTFFLIYLGLYHDVI